MKLFVTREQAGAILGISGRHFVRQYVDKDLIRPIKFWQGKKSSHRYLRELVEKLKR